MSALPLANEFAIGASDEAPGIPDDDVMPSLAHGWTPELKTRFLDRLAECGNVRAACKCVCLSREGAYRLRRRDPLFARGWAAALLKARDVTEDELADRALDGVEEQIYYRGELVGTRRRYDTRLLLAHLARLDKLVDEKQAGADAARFDELLSIIAAESLGLKPRDPGDPLPPDRETMAQSFAEEAELDARRVKAEAEDSAEAEGEPEFDQAASEAFEEECISAFQRGRAEGEAAWDRFRFEACALVDDVTGWFDEPPAIGLPGNPLPPPPVPASASEAGEGVAFFFPWTVSDVSTPALARSLAAAEGVGWRVEYRPPRRSTH